MSHDHATQRRLLRLAAQYATRTDHEYSIDTFIDLLSDLDAANPALGTHDRREAIAADLEAGERFLALLPNGPRTVSEQARGAA